MVMNRKDIANVPTRTTSHSTSTAIKAIARQRNNQPQRAQASQRDRRDSTFAHNLIGDSWVGSHDFSLGDARVLFKSGWAGTDKVQDDAIERHENTYDEQDTPAPFVGAGSIIFAYTTHLELHLHARRILGCAEGRIMTKTLHPDFGASGAV